MRRHCDHSRPRASGLELWATVLKGAVRHADGNDDRLVDLSSFPGPSLSTVDRQDPRPQGSVHMSQLRRKCSTARSIGEEPQRLNLTRSRSACSSDCATVRGNLAAGSGWVADRFSCSNHVRKVPLRRDRFGLPSGCAGSVARRGTTRRRVRRAHPTEGRGSRSRARHATTTRSAGCAG